MTRGLAKFHKSIMGFLPACLSFMHAGIKAIFLKNTTIAVAHSQSNSFVSYLRKISNAATRVANLV